MSQETYIEKHVKPTDKAPTTPADVEDVAANKFIDDIYQCGCGSTTKDKGSWVEKETRVDKDTYFAEKKTLGDKKIMGDKDVTFKDNEAYIGEKKPFTSDKDIIADKIILAKEQDAYGGVKEEFKGEKDLVCEKESNFKDKVTPEELAAFEQELQRQEALSNKMRSALRAGNLGDAQTRGAIADNFRVLAGSAGREGELQLLNKINAGLKADNSQYRLRFGQNIIKTPGGRHLEIVDGSGRVTDSMDFVVPDSFGGRDSNGNLIRKQTTPGKEKSVNANVTKDN